MPTIFSFAIYGRCTCIRSERNGESASTPRLRFVRSRFISSSVYGETNVIGGIRNWKSFRSIGSKFRSVSSLAENHKAHLIYGFPPNNHYNRIQDNRPHFLVRDLQRSAFVQSIFLCAFSHTLSHKNKIFVNIPSQLYHTPVACQYITEIFLPSFSAKHDSAEKDGIVIIRCA